MKWIYCGVNAERKPIWFSPKEITLSKNLKLVTKEQYKEIEESFNEKLKHLRIYKIQKTRPRGFY